MKYKDLDPDEVFFFDDNFDYPKVKTENGHKDLRDNVTGSMPDDYEVVSVHALTSERDRLREAVKRGKATPDFIQEAGGLWKEFTEKERYDAYSGAIAVCQAMDSALDKDA